MLKVAHSVLIGRPIELVFGFAGDFSNDPHWRFDVRSMGCLGGVAAQGIRTVGVVEEEGTRVEVFSEIIEYQRFRKIVSRSVVNGKPMISTRYFQGFGHRTRVTYVLECDDGNTLRDRLLRPFAARRRHATLVRYLKRLKYLAEHGHVQKVLRTAPR